MKALKIILLFAIVLIGSLEATAQRFRMEEVDNSKLEVVFDAFRIDDQVRFVWNINNEDNIKSYEITRGTESGRFVNWEILTSLNVNTPGNYSFIDKDPVLGEMHYRLKLIAPDGSSIEYSPLFRISTPLPEGHVKRE